MQVSVEATSELSRKMTVTVSEEKISQQVNSKLQSLSGNVKIDGFRPGKVPQAVVKKRYGQQVREEVVSDLIQSSFYDAVREEKLNPAGDLVWAIQLGGVDWDDAKAIALDAAGYVYVVGNFTNFRHSSWMNWFFK